MKITFSSTAKEIYKTWLSSEGHTKMTGGDAVVSDKTGENFTAWNEYIIGQNLQLEPYKRIVQSWRTSEFDDNDEDSQIEILLNESNGMTELTLIHTKILEDGEHYKIGWENHYFEPMAIYFSK